MLKFLSGFKFHKLVSFYHSLKGVYVHSYCYVLSIGAATTTVCSSTTTTAVAATPTSAETASVASGATSVSATPSIFGTPTGTISGLAAATVSTSAPTSTALGTVPATTIATSGGELDGGKRKLGFSTVGILGAAIRNRYTDLTLTTTIESCQQVI